MISNLILILILFGLLIQKSISSNNKSQIYGFSVHVSQLKLINDVPQIDSDSLITLTLYGHALNESNFVSFTNINGSLFSKCDKLRSTNSFSLQHNFNSSKLIISLYSSNKNEKFFFFCLGNSFIVDNDTNVIIWRHQGYSKNVIFSVKRTILPFWTKIVCIIILFAFSGLFSGLNLGLMSLSLTDLQLFEAAGSPQEKRYAHIIRPVRNHGNFLLSTLLIGNVIVNSTLTIFVDDLTGNGIIAVLGSSIGIVIFGEIIPQAVTSRYALIIGAKTMWITKFFMIITFVLSFPIGKILDALLGKELGMVYNREKLEILVREQQKMGSVVKEEVNIITGALNITTKTVREIMTPLDYAFMIPNSSILNFDLLNQIVGNGFTRIPVYEKERNNIIAVLNIKDLTLIDCDENIPVKTVCSFYKRPIVVVDEKTYLREILEEFKKGRTHLAFVSEFMNSSKKDVIIGLVTLEDVIEEIIQAEIIDETDIITDNVERKRRSVMKQDFGCLQELGTESDMTPQLKLTALQHLYAGVSSFQEDFINFNVLKSLLNADIVVKFNRNTQNESANTIVKKGKAMHSAILLLEGRVSISISKENLYFEVGALMFFGETILKNINASFQIKNLQEDQLINIVEKAYKVSKYIPDYSLVALSDVLYLTVSIEHYIFARFLSMKKADHNIVFPAKILSSFDNESALSFQNEWDIYWKKNDERLSVVNEDMKLNNVKKHSNNNCFQRKFKHSSELRRSFTDIYSDLDPLLPS